MHVGSRQSSRSTLVHENAMDYQWRSTTKTAEKDVDWCGWCMAEEKHARDWLAGAWWRRSTNLVHKKKGGKQWRGWCLARKKMSRLDTSRRLIGWAFNFFFKKKVNRESGRVWDPRPEKAWGRAWIGTHVVIPVRPKKERMKYDTISFKSV